MEEPRLVVLGSEAHGHLLAEQLGVRSDIPRHLFQQLIAKASDDVKKRLGRERPELVAQIQNSVSEVAGSLQ